MHDTLEYFQTDPYFRCGNYHKLSFSMMYFRNEHYLLPFSHDEVVHGKATIAQKMWGDYEQKFPQARSLYLYMMVHPGKKLNFMGSEVAQLREWDEKREQDWFLKQYPLHDSFYHYCCDLNHLYLKHPALWDQDYVDAGFQWRDVASEERVMYAIERRSKKGERLVAVFNLSGADQRDYKVKIPGAKNMRVLLDTSWDVYSGVTPKGKQRVSFDAKTEELACTLPAFASILLEVKE